MLPMVGVMAMRTVSEPSGNHERATDGEGAHIGRDSLSELWVGGVRFASPDERAENASVRAVVARSGLAYHSVWI